MTTDITHLWRLIGYASRRRAIVRRIEVHVKGALNYPPIALSYEGVHVGQVLTGKSPPAYRLTAAKCVGQGLPRHLTGGAAAMPPKAATAGLRHRGG